MKRINRREFGRLAGAAALGAPLAKGFAWAAATWDAAPQQKSKAPASKSKSAPKLVVTKEQEEKLQEALARRNKQLARMRERTLPYSAEPAFVFRVKSLARPGGKAR